MKCNHKNMFQDNVRRMCKTAEETQEHVLEKCMNKNRTEVGNVMTQDIFKEDSEKLKFTE